MLIDSRIQITKYDKMFSAKYKELYRDTLSNSIELFQFTIAVLSAEDQFLCQEL